MGGQRRPQEEWRSEQTAPIRLNERRPTGSAHGARGQAAGKQSAGCEPPVPAPPPQTEARFSAEAGRRGGAEAGSGSAGASQRQATHAGSRPLVGARVSRPPGWPPGEGRAGPPLHSGVRQSGARWSSAGVSWRACTVSKFEMPACQAASVSVAAGGWQQPAAAGPRALRRLKGGGKQAAGRTWMNRTSLSMISQLEAGRPGGGRGSSLPPGSAGAAPTCCCCC